MLNANLNGSSVWQGGLVSFTGSAWYVHVSKVGGGNVQSITDLCEFNQFKGASSKILYAI